MKQMEVESVLKGNAYPGRGILIGKSADGTKACVAYFIMGRSENSRNRIFELKDGSLFTAPFDASKVEDPRLIIYRALSSFENKLIVTNGDQTDTILAGLEQGIGFQKALESRCFEPDAPHFTPRISGLLTFENGDFRYEMSILKSIDSEGSACARYHFSYPVKAGVGHLIHTYQSDGSPLPSFEGEPRAVQIESDIDTFTRELWQALDDDNKISLFVRFVDLENGESEDRMINKKELL